MLTSPDQCQLAKVVCCGYKSHDVAEVEEAEVSLPYPQLSEKVLVSLLGFVPGLELLNYVVDYGQEGAANANDDESVMIVLG